MARTPKIHYSKDAEVRCGSPSGKNAKTAFDIGDVNCKACLGLENGVAHKRIENSLKNRPALRRFISSSLKDGKMI